MLVAMLRGDPDLILDSGSVRATRGGDLTGPNPSPRARPVGRGQRGTESHLATTGDGVVPVAGAATAAILGSGPRTTAPSCSSGCS